MGTLSGLSVAENIFLGHEDPFMNHGIKNTRAMIKEAQRLLDEYGFKNIKAGAMIDKAIELGATNIDSLNFTLSTYEKQCDELLATASKKTRTRADLMATAAGTIITGVKTLNGSCNSSGNNQRVPVYGGSVNTYNLQSEFIIPQSSLTEMVGGKISKLTFYSS